MSDTSQVLADSSVQTFEFKRLISESDRGNLIEKLVKELGIVYVTSITRDGCSGCAEQKPLFRELARKTTGKHQGKLMFSKIHVRYSEEDQSESAEGKKALGHAAYPTYMVHVLSRFGPLEAYRAIYPTMDELETQIENTVELADFYKEDAEKTRKS
jgi:hypothetical protein